MPLPPVPYYSQWESPEIVGALLAGTVRAADDPRWADSGAATPEEYEFWSWRACGMACLRMVLAARGRHVPPMVPLALECADHGGYVRHADRVDGLIYAPFATWVRDRFGLDVEVRPALQVSELTAAAGEGALVMASVHHSIRDHTATPPHRGGHLVLVTGAADEQLTINNPSGLHGTSQRAVTIPLGAFTRFFAGRGMVISG